MAEIYSEPEATMDIDRSQGFLGYPVNLPDPTSTANVFTWNIDSGYGLNTLKFRFGGISTDEEPNNACSNKLAVNDEEFCLFKYTGGDSFSKTVDDKQATITFTTSGIARNGFVAYFKAEWNCDQTIDVSSYGTLRSPNYPLTYPKYTSCQILLKAPYGYQVELNFDVFDRNVCHFLAGDDFHVLDMSREEASTLFDCSTGGVPGSVQTTKGQMKIIFTSDGNSFDEISGFKLSYALTGGSGGVRPTDTDGAYESVKNERDTFQSALIGVSVAAGVVIVCLIAMMGKLMANRGHRTKRSPEVQNNPAVSVIAHQQPAQMAGNNGQDNRGFNM